MPDTPNEDRTYVLYRRRSNEYSPPDDHICRDKDTDEWLAPDESNLDALEGAGLIEVLQWAFERDQDIFLSGPPEPVIQEGGGVGLVKPRDDGKGVLTLKIGKFECQRCGTVQGKQIEIGEEPSPPVQCVQCERQGPFEAHGLSETDMELGTVANPMWSPPTDVTDARYSDLWNVVRAYLKEYWWTDDEAMYDGLTAYAISTWLRPNYDFLPHLAVIGKFETGKSRLLNTLANVSYRGIVPVDASAASVFRTIDAYDTTFLLSEFHDLIEETRQEVNSLIKGAQKRGEIVLRAEAKGDSHHPRAFNVFTHVGIGTQYGLPDDTASRCIEVTTKPAEKHVPDLRDRPEIRNELLFARYRLLDSPEWDEAWRRADQHLQSKGVKGRLREKLLSLVTVADLWGEREAMDAFIVKMQAHQREVSASSEDAMVIQAMMEVAFEKVSELHVESLSEDHIEDPWAEISLPYSDILEKYEQITGMEMSSAKFGHMRKRLGLQKVKKADGTVVQQDDLRDELKRLATESGLEWRSLEAEAMKEEENGPVKATTSGDGLYREIEPPSDDDDEKTQADCVNGIIDTIRKYSGPGVPASREAILDELTSDGFDEEYIEHYLGKLKERGAIQEPDENCFYLNE